MKSVGKNLEFIKKNKLRITIEVRHMPGGAEHNLICWLCNRRSAVYSMYPYWMFLPCWKCQNNIKGEGVWNILKRKWYQLWRMRSIIIKSKSNIADTRGTLVTVYKIGGTFCCKTGREDEEGVIGYGGTKKQAMENWNYRKTDFDRGYEKAIEEISVLGLEHIKKTFTDHFKPSTKEVESWEKEFDEEFDQYNPINDKGITTPYWSGADYNAIKDFIRKTLSESRKELLEEVARQLEMTVLLYEKEMYDSETLESLESRIRAYIRHELKAKLNKLK